ncbi:MAG TPA: glycosyltransferase family 4 protein [Vicinamibacterales bacterium]|jgi:glycosyltransferase involved in cell wall biosynthesis
MATAHTRSRAMQENVSEALSGAREINIGLLTGGVDRPYALGLARALLSKSIAVDFIGSDDLDSPELRRNSKLRFLNLRGSQREDAPVMAKAGRILRYYGLLIRYVWSAKPRIVHILWNNKFEHFDRTVLMLYYRLLGKKIAFTAHNINAGKRDAKDSWFNRLTLSFQYRLCHHVFVHTDTMRQELRQDFAVPDHSITVIPFGLNAGASETDLTTGAAKRRLGLAADDKTLLFFGHIGPYKGLETLVAAFQIVAADDPTYRLIIAGKPDPGAELYLEGIQRAIAQHPSSARVMQKIEFIPDEDTEIYFKAADVLVLPYTFVSQSGVLILGYRFGLPAIATEVGSFRDDIVEGRTGFVCSPGIPAGMAEAIQTYFRSNLFATLERQRAYIRAYAARRYSWDAVSRLTQTVYHRLLAE